MKRFAVVGSPITHSLSPVIHQAAFASLGLDWEYSAHQVGQGELRSFLAEHELAGLSITMPLKEEAVTLASELDVWARKTGVVNTLVPSADGLFGANTDVIGFRSVFDDHHLSDLESVIVIGNGATARSAVAAVRDRCRQLSVVARRIDLLIPSVDQALPWGSPLDAQLVINTTPSQAAGTLSPSVGLYFDVIYSPWPTPLAAAWKGSVISGLELLIAQAAAQTALFVAPREIQFDEVRHAMREAVSDRFLSN